MLARRIVPKGVSEAGSISVQWILIVKEKSTTNQGILKFDSGVLKEVMTFLMAEGDISQPVSLLMKNSARFRCYQTILLSMKTVMSFLCLLYT